jgi:hypothetical protein
MRQTYQQGEAVEIAIINQSDDVYYYQHSYPALLQPAILQ